MQKKDIINEVCRRTGASRNECNVIINAAIEVVKEKFCNGTPVYIRGLFSLVPKKHKEKVGQIITKKKSIIIPAHYAPKAIFSKEICEKMKVLPFK